MRHDSRGNNKIAITEYRVKYKLKLDSLEKNFASNKAVYNIRLLHRVEIVKKIRFSLSGDKQKTLSSSLSVLISLVLLSA
mmetsp:Transcript_40450/g.42213  ORF Transcript_40450/g.42213 Transcript_40450/m.42213 type:complete len:80 (-) Transcript_40450:336-575(-)